MRRFYAVALACALVFFGRAALLIRASASAASSPAVAHIYHPPAVNSRVPAPVARFLALETSNDLFRVLYQYGRNTSAPNGSVGPNVSARPDAWYIEYQRAGGVNVIAGVLRHDLSLIDSGLRMFAFGLDRENSRGRFPGSMWPFHGTAMFLAEAAPSLLVLRYSSFGARYERLVRQDARLMQRAAYAMVRSVGGVGHIDDATKTHRRFEAALAMEAVGELAADGTLRRWARVYARQGVRLTRADGVMPEDRGHDSGYQALGLTYATRYLTFVGPGSVSSPLRAAVERGVRWEASRVRADGSIDHAGDTRTAGCRERDPEGRCKTTFYATISNALTRWAVLAHDAALAREALKVWLINWSQQPGDVLPPAGLHAQPDSLAAGQWLTVSGARFQPLETVKVSFDGHLEQTVQCDQIGSFGGHSPEPNAHFPVPAIPPGAYRVEARGSFGTLRETTVRIAS